MKNHLLTPFLALVLMRFCMVDCAADGLIIEDLGKKFAFDPAKTLPGLFHTIERKIDVIGGNTSIRNISAEHLGWKGKDDHNGVGYFMRNRDLGQVFNVTATEDVSIAALVLRTSRGDNAVMKGAPGSVMYLQFFEVEIQPGEELRINDNGTPVGSRATHGFDLALHRADDYVEGVVYRPIARYTGGIFPDIEPTTQFAYQRKKGQPFGEQPGHLRFFRLRLPSAPPLVLKAGGRYAFLVGFEKPGPDRGLALAVSTKTHSLDPPELLKDINGHIYWGIRREGDGTLPPTMLNDPSAPTDPSLRQKLEKEAVFAPNHWENLAPTSNGFPDVDTYRTLQYCLELSDSE